MISERKVYTVPGSSPLATTPCSSSVSFLRIPSVTSLSLMLVEGSEVKNRSTMCVPSAEKESKYIYKAASETTTNILNNLSVQFIHWKMLQKFCLKTCHKILSLLSNKYKEKPKTWIIHFRDSLDLREISLVMAISSWSVTISANLSLNSFDQVSPSFNHLKITYIYILLLIKPAEGNNFIVQVYTGSGIAQFKEAGK